MRLRETVSKEKALEINCLIENVLEILNSSIDFAELEKHTNQDEIIFWKNFVNHPILKLDEEIVKTLKDDSKLSQPVTSYSLERYNKDINKIKIMTIDYNVFTQQNDAFFNASNYFDSLLVTVYFNDHKRPKFFLVKGPSLKTLLTYLAEIEKLILERDVEKMLTKKGRRTTQPLPKYFWSTSGAWSTESKNEKIYHSLLDKFIIDEFVETIKNLPKSTTINILDVGAGKGRLCKKLLEIAKEYGIKVRYLFNEPDDTQIKFAKEYLADTQNDDDLIVEFFELKLEDFIREYGEQYNKNINIIISSGGPLNAQIASHAETILHLKAMRSLLQTDGVIIACGKTYVLFNKKELESLGFFVTQTSKKFTREDINKTYPFYVFK